MSETVKPAPDAQDPNPMRWIRDWDSDKPDAIALDMLVSIEPRRPFLRRQKILFLALERLISLGRFPFDVPNTDLQPRRGWYVRKFDGGQVQENMISFRRPWEVFEMRYQMMLEALAFEGNRLLEDRRFRLAKFPMPPKLEDLSKKP